MTNILNNKNVRLLAILPVFLLTACIAEPEEEEYDDSATMCYDISGDTMTVRCVYNDSSSCSAYDQYSLAVYDDWSTCYNDIDTVLQSWEDNEGVVAGPNSQGNSGSGSGSGSGSTGTYDYTYTCPSGVSYTVPVPDDSCSDESEYFAETFGCNLYEDYGDACYEYYGCLGASSSELEAACGGY